MKPCVWKITLNQWWNLPSKVIVDCMDLEFLAMSLQPSGMPVVFVGKNGCLVSTEILNETMHTQSISERYHPSGCVLYCN